MTAGLQPVLEAKNLRRSFDRGSFIAVDDVSLSVRRGEVLGLLGPNGAGKTTVVKMCSTLLAPSGGQVSILGIDAVNQPEAARRQLGLMLGGELGFYGRATVRDNLLFFADVAAVKRNRLPVVRSALHRVGLADVEDRKVHHLSRGMKQRLHLARALLAEPPLLILDEPTTGLDPDVAIEMRELIAQIASDGTAVLLTTHSMHEAEKLADRLVVIGAGRVVVEGSVENVAEIAGVGRISNFSVGALMPAESKAISVLPDVLEVHSDVREDRVYVQVAWSTSATPDQIGRLVDVLPADAVDLYTRPAHLEEAYLVLASRLKR